MQNTAKTKLTNKWLFEVVHCTRRQSCAEWQRWCARREREGEGAVHMATNSYSRSEQLYLDWPHTLTHCLARFKSALVCMHLTKIALSRLFSQQHFAAFFNAHSNSGGHYCQQSFPAMEIFSVSSPPLFLSATESDSPPPPLSSAEKIKQITIR